MNDQYSALRSNVSMLGQLLGKTIKAHHGEAFLEKIETIRQLAKSSRKGNDDDRHHLITLLQNLSDDELLPVARAFSQFLNLANVAEQFHTMSRYGELRTTEDPLDQLFHQLKQANLNNQSIIDAIQQLDIELVLTAHPTEVTRRTMIHKHVQLNDCLKALDLPELTAQEAKNFQDRIEQIIIQAWHSNEIRQQRPTPIDEARSGFAVIENNLWPAIPRFLRQLDERLQQNFQVRLPLNAHPIRIASWMGGDRDGNPFVTAKVTQEAILLSRWVALGLFYQDLHDLVFELSMEDCSDELRARVGDSPEPYRAILRILRDELRETQLAVNAQLNGQYTENRDLITRTEQLQAPLELCYRSLQSCGMGIIADGMLLDVLRKVSCFGIHLLRLDIRQDGERHGQVLSELTQYLEIGDYLSWDETQKQEFLLRELQSKRPLLPRDWKPSAENLEVIETCKVVAQADPEALGIYIISMARQPSDVLAVQLLLKECGCHHNIPIAPLFETQNDLHHAALVLNRLLAVDWYRNYIHGQQYIMIGYSDSAKDAGMMAAGWAQYRAMEDLVAIAEKEHIKLTLFHGRGGTIGRGGGPAHQAILSQPPGSLKGGFRVTEQGEMIRFKFGLPEIAIQNFKLYVSAVVEANLLPPPKPKAPWYDIMDTLATISCTHYRSIVRDEPDFVPYFRAATPELELGKLPLGSRPAKRKPDGGVESLRAIPWIFAWTQNRLMLPSWLGAHIALEQVIDANNLPILKEMDKQWPFFHSRLEMLEMVLLKADLWLAEYYDLRLVPTSLWPLGQKLRQELKDSIAVILQIRPQGGELLDDQPWIKESIMLRNPYTDPLNVLQVELLNRARANGDTIHPQVDQALMVTIAGIAAGMRNTG